MDGEYYSRLVFLVKNTPGIYNLLPFNLQSRQELIEVILKCSCSLMDLQALPDFIINNEEVIFSKIKRNAYLIKAVPEEFLNKSYFLERCIEINENVLSIIDYSQINNETVLISLIESHGDKIIGEYWPDNEEVYLTVCKKVLCDFNFDFSNLSGVSHELCNYVFTV